MNLPVTRELGPLDIIEIYSYYDGPRLVSCKRPGGEVLLAVWIGGALGDSSWYVAPLTKLEFRELRFGRLELRTAFERTEAGFIWLITERPKKLAEARRIELKDVRKDWLPESGEALDLLKGVRDQRGQIVLRPPDLVEASAVDAVHRFFEKYRDSVVTSRQLEIYLEDDFYHWVTNRAIRDLVNSGELKTEEKELSFGGKTKLIWSRGNRYQRRHARKVTDLVDRYSSPNVAGTLGYHAELLVFEGFARTGFGLKARGVNRYGEKTWTGSKHNLDFIFERDGVGYGVEVKNTLGYPDIDELRVKIQIARELGVRPVVVARMLPRAWMHELIEAGGFGLVLKYQLYPPSLSGIVDEIRLKMSLPVDTPKMLADKTMTRFEDWHKAQI